MQQQSVAHDLRVRDAAAAVACVLSCCVSGAEVLDVVLRGVGDADMCGLIAFVTTYNDVLAMLCEERDEGVRIGHIADGHVVVGTGGSVCGMMFSQSHLLHDHLLTRQQLAHSTHDLTLRLSR